MNPPPSAPLDQPGTGSLASGAPPPRAKSQSAWGPPSQPQGLRRGLPPISTASTSASARPNSSLSPSRGGFSPVNSGYQLLPSGSGKQLLNRTPSISSTTPPFSLLQPGVQQAQSAQVLPSSRSRNALSASSSQVASTATALPSSSQGGGGGGNGGGGGSLRLARASPSLSQSSVGSPSTTSNPASASSVVQLGSLSKVVIAQVFLLLSTIKEDGDKAKWESQADQIRRVGRSSIFASRCSYTSADCESS